MEATCVEHLEARLIALELPFRGFPSGSVANCSNPIGEIDRMEEEFRPTISWTKFGDEDERSECIRALVVATIDKNFKAVRTRALRHVEIEAASKTRN
ncbi:hypothetical protein [Bradyrhizobium sp. USDA 3364]